MGKCQFYNLYTVELPSNELRVDRQTSSFPHNQVRVCDHKHSPLSRNKITKGLSGQISLTCNGELSKCQIPPDKIADAFD